MGASLERPVRGNSVCPLCHNECHHPAILKCKHRFCQACILELWSGSSNGPYYCPECRAEYRKLPEFENDAERPSTSSWRNGAYRHGHFPASRLLGKRQASAPLHGQSNEGKRPARSGEGERPTPPVSSGGTTSRCKTSVSEMPSQTGSPPKRNTGSEQDLPPATETPQRNTSCDKDMGGAPQAKACTMNTAFRNKRTPERAGDTSPVQEAPPSPKEVALPCHYCPSPEQLRAVKTCLVCGASMCTEHLRPHLESPVFKSHPLVPPVEDVTLWRCQEHQEMNKIYCGECRACVCTVCTVIGAHRDHACVSIREAERDLRGKLKNDMKQLQECEQTVITKVAELKERKQGFQEVLDQARHRVQQQYRTMHEAMELEEQQALACVAQQEDRVLGGVDQQLATLQDTLRSIQRNVHTLEELSDATGDARFRDQTFIMEYIKVTNSLSSTSSPVEALDPVEEVDHGRLSCLQEWTERRLDTVIVSLPARDPFKLLYGTSPCLDPDTAHPRLLLSDNQRAVSYSEAQQPCAELETRFTSFPQVLALSALEGGRWYWEVEVTQSDEGRWKVGVSEGRIGRKGQKDACRLGFNPYSWCLVSEKGRIEALHDKVAEEVSAGHLHRVALLLDFEEGSLSFYSVPEGGALVFLHRFEQRFAQPLYPALAVSRTQLAIIDLFHKESSE